VDGIQLRAADPDDFGAVLPLVQAFYQEEGFTTPAERLSTNLATLLRAQDARVAVAVTVDGLVGFAVTTTSFGLEQGHLAELEDLYVVPGERGRGVGAALIEDSATWADQRGCRELEVVLAPHDRDIGRLMAYYRQHDFADEGRRLLSRVLGPAPHRPDQHAAG